jgi:endonuclease/exonuclease/phosphatase family metal-dependent hydrolase
VFHPVRRGLVPALLITALACARSPIRTAKTAGPGPSLKVMTYNVNFGIPGDASTIRAIRESGADVVFLQETNARWEEALWSTTSDIYPLTAFHHWGGAGGLGVLSRLPFDDGGLIRPEGDGWFPGWRLIVTTAFGPVQVLSVHLHPPVSEGGSFVAGYFTTGGVRKGEMERFVAHLDPALPTLIVGDFNEADGQAMRFLASRGLRSALPEFKPHANTWHWPTSVMTFRERLDHIVYDPRLEPLMAEVLYQGRSDHYPVISVLVPAQTSPPMRREHEIRTPDGPSGARLHQR